jgi:hypothetical protein
VMRLRKLFYISVVIHCMKNKNFLCKLLLLFATFFEKINSCYEFILQDGNLKNRWLLISVAEPHHFYAAPAPGENFDAAPAPAAPAPTLLYGKAKFLKRTKV